MRHEVFENLERQMEIGNTADLTFETEDHSVVRRFVPKERLILLGGGHIALALSRAASLLDFSVSVADDRPSFCNPVRFPDAEHTVCDSFENAVRSFGIRETDYVCILTRGHVHDAECMREILKGTMPKYLGMIGSKRRVHGMMEMLTEEGFPQERLDRVEAPIGLDINAQTTMEIAFSIAAQLVEYRRKGVKRHGEAENGVLTENSINPDLLRALADPKEPTMLALVTRTQGSTPVKSGSMMAVGRLGRIEGTIGGGCGESEILQISRSLVGTGGRREVTVNMTNDVAGDEGMVCGGRMTVLLEDIE